MVEVEGEAQVAEEGDVSVDCWVDFGKIWWPVVLGILEVGGGGLLWRFPVVLGDAESGMAVGWRGCIAGR